jgi:hypothetical protein
MESQGLFLGFLTDSALADDESEPRPRTATAPSTKLGVPDGIRARWRALRKARASVTESGRGPLRLSEAKELAYQICASSNPLISWMRQIEGLRSVT